MHFTKKKVPESYNIMLYNNPIQREENLNIKEFGWILK